MLDRFPRIVLAAIGVVGLGAAQAQAVEAQKIATFKNWSAYTSGEGEAKVCYALSTPTAKEPAKLKRDPVYFLINDWPARNPKAKAEPEIVPGYEYKDGTKVTAEVGSDKFEFFTKNEGKSGAAWVQDPADEARLVDAMRRGAEIIVVGTSHRGSLTHDTYSLAGFGEALDKAHEACGL